MIFTTTSELKEILGMAINADVEFNDMKPYLNDAANEWAFISIIGEPLLTYLGTVNANTVAAPYDKALVLAKTFIACRAIAESYRINSIQFGSGGNNRFESDNAKTPFKYQEQGFIESNNARAYRALDELHIYLLANATTITQWDADSKANARALIINTAQGFARVYARQLSRETFENIKPLLSEVEAMLLIPSIGLAQYNVVKSAIASGTIPAAVAAILLPLQRAVAQSTIAAALSRNMVQLQGATVVTVQYDSNSAPETRNIPGNELQITYNHLKDFAVAHLHNAIGIMKATPADYPEFTEWDAAKSAAAKTTLEETTGYTADESTILHTHETYDQFSRYPHKHPPRNTKPFFV